MEFTQETISKLIKDYDELYDKIYDVVDLIGAKKDLSYDIVSIKESDGHIIVHVEYYKWQDINNDVLSFDCSLITDPSAFKNFKKEVEEIVEERKRISEKKAKIKENEELLKAMKLLKEKGYEISENGKS